MSPRSPSHCLIPLTFSLCLLSCVTAETEASRYTRAASAETLCLPAVAADMTRSLAHTRTAPDEDTVRCACRLWTRPSGMRCLWRGDPSTFTAGGKPPRSSRVVLFSLLSKFVSALQGLMKDQAKLVIVINGSGLTALSTGCS